MESLVNDLTNALANSNASLVFKKTSLNTTCQKYRKHLNLKKFARKNLRLCHHNVKQRSNKLRQSSNLKLHRSEGLSNAKTNASSSFVVNSTETGSCKRDTSLMSNRKYFSHKSNTGNHHNQHQQHNHKQKHSHHHHHHHHHRQSHKQRQQRHKSNHRHRHNSSIRSSSLNKHKHIMTLLIAARASIQAKTKKNMKITMGKEGKNVSSASSSSTCLSNASSDSFKNLIRFKHTLKDRRKSGLKERNYLESTETLCGTHHQAGANLIECDQGLGLENVSRFPGNRKKILNLYKVQKTYRYRNYRLHCVRLRRLEKKSKKKQLMLRSRPQNNFTHLLNTTHHGNRLTYVSTATSTSSSGTSSSSTENFDLEESSCNTGCLCSSEEIVNGGSKRNRISNKISESRSMSSSTSSNDNETSSSSASGRSRSSSRSSHLSFSTTHSKENTTSDLEIDTSSLVESFNMANLNSGSEGSNKQNSANKQKSKDKNCKNSNKNKRRLLSRRQRRQLQQLKQPHGSDKNKKFNITNLSISSSNKNSSTNFINHNLTSNNNNNNNTFSMKSKFCESEQASLSACNFKRKRLSSNHNINNIEIEDIDREQETKSTLLNRSSNLEDVEINRKAGKSERNYFVVMDEKINSSDEIEYEKSFICSNDEGTNKEAPSFNSKNADEADDEQSDWNERITSYLSSVSEAQKEKASSNNFEAIPWWDQNSEGLLNEDKESRPLDLSTKKRSSYEKLNSTQSNIFNNIEDDDEKEFKEILTGALSLMNTESTCIYQSKVKDSIQRQQKPSNRKKRFNSFASDYNTNCNIATKSTANLNSLLIEAQAVNNQPIPESNIGNKMLKNMGWSPGLPLGSSKSDNNNLLTPIQTVKRPNRIGLGYDPFSAKK